MFDESRKLQHEVQKGYSKGYTHYEHVTAPESRAKLLNKYMYKLSNIIRHGDLHRSSGSSSSIFTVSALVS